MHYNDRHGPLTLFPPVISRLPLAQKSTCNRSLGPQHVALQVGVCSSEASDLRIALGSSAGDPGRDET